MDNKLQFKLCASCKSMIPKNNKGWYCRNCKSNNRKENKNIYNKENKIYSSNKWKKTRDRIRKSNVFCEVCQEIGIKGILATEVHHLIKVGFGNKDTHYDENLLVSVCNRHHKMIENMTKEELIIALQNGSLR